MPRFRKKPVVVEAVQWFRFGDHPAVTPGYELPGGSLVDRDGIKYWSGYPRRKEVPVIKTLEGWYEVTPCDWIITGVAGEQYPCKDEIFRQTYEPVEE